MKRFATILVIVCALAPLAQAQLIEVVAGYLLNRVMARSETKEVSAGKIVCNVWLEESEEGKDKLRQLPGWDGSTQTSAYWSDDVVLEPVLIVNSSVSPREVQWSLSDRNGPVRKIQYNPVKGGARGKEGEAKDNSGYKYDSPLIHVRDLPKGWFALHASWGKGMSATIQAERFSIRDFMPFVDDARTMEALAGAGQSTYPVVPVFTGRMPNGDLKFFNSAEEFQLALSKLNEDAQKAKQRAQTPPAEPLPATVKSCPVEIHIGLYDRSILKGKNLANVFAGLSQKLIAQKSLADTDEPIQIPDGCWLAILILSKDKIEAQLVSPEGELVQELSPVEKDGIYALFVPLTFTARSTRNTLVITTESGAPRQLTFKQVK